MHSIPSSRSNKSVRTKPESSFSRVSETMKQTNEVEKSVKAGAGRKLKLWSKQQDGKRTLFQKEKSSSVRSLRRIKRRLFLDAVKSSPRQQHPSVPGKKNRTGQE
mmetsp:Transcript_11391/g.17393  ORF Transcript_11391/g.17393 Transcript_11391/m.17393 type:complete len:105 (+) Transcript_11391:2-316(+)